MGHHPATALSESEKEEEILFAIRKKGAASLMGPVMGTEADAHQLKKQIENIRTDTEFEIIKLKVVE